MKKVHHSIAFVKENSSPGTVLSQGTDTLGNCVYSVKLDETGEIKHLGSNDVVILGETQYTK